MSAHLRFWRWRASQWTRGCKRAVGLYGGSVARIERPAATLLSHVPPLDAALLRSGWRMTRHPQRGAAGIPPYTFVNVFCFKYLHFAFTHVNNGWLRIIAMSRGGVNTLSSSQLL
jgi:hypothetical protein